MSIKPIDIVKSTDAAQYKQIQNQKFQHEQVQISRDFQNHIQSETSRPVETKKSENNEYRFDAKEESRNKYRVMKAKKKQKQNNNNDNRPDNTGKRPGGIDILI